MAQDNDSTEHLDLERISAHLDEPGEDPEAAAHLERCERCEREEERMRRMRMALSALGDLNPPEDEWERIEPHLPEEDAAGLPGGEGDGLPLFGSGWVPRLAAATVVFAVGLGAGLQLRDGGSAPGEPAASSGQPAASVASGGRPAGADGGPSAMQGSSPYLSVARNLENLVGGGPEVEPLDDPVAAAEQMARLEALAEAAREALRERPADPALNNFLFRVSERQEALRSRLGAAARLTSLDYR